MATKHGKKFREAAAKVDRAAVYSPLEAVKLVKELSAAKFDETVEAHFRLGIDTRKADQNIRGSISLPHGTGKTVRVAVFAEGAQAEQAAEAGADVIGSDELIAQIQKGEINFDAAIATPMMMAVGRIGKILGPRGLMPNPKLGTVTMDVAKMVSELKAGRVEYRADRYGICTCHWARSPSMSRSSLRTTPPSTPRSSASSRLPPRASTSRASPCPLPWALASRLTPPFSATSWRPKRYVASYI